uniref:Uncharacterized protein n=1 Tax=Fundulus heteroclitus TaxID=8078 RepID=A0A3Q2PC76_FUNHE
MELDLSVNYGGQTEKQTQQPQNETHNLSVQLPINADHDQAVDAGVEVDDYIGVELVQDVHRPEREAAQEEEVCQSQVAQIYLCYSQSVLVGHKHSKDKAVEEQS